MSTTDQLLTPPQVARVLGTQTYDVLVLIDGGELPRVRGEDGLVYIPADAVELYARAQR